MEDLVREAEAAGPPIGRQHVDQLRALLRAEQLLANAIPTARRHPGRRPPSAELSSAVVGSPDFVEIILSAVSIGGVWAASIDRVYRILESAEHWHVAHTTSSAFLPCFTNYQCKWSLRALTDVCDARSHFAQIIWLHTSHTMHSIHIVERQLTNGQTVQCWKGTTAQRHGILKKWAGVKEFKTKVFRMSSSRSCRRAARVWSTRNPFASPPPALIHRPWLCI